MFKRSKGFTLIELIVVIAIIAILAAILMVSVTGYIAKSKQAAITAELKSFHVLATNVIISSSGMSGYATLYASCSPETSIADQASGSFNPDTGFNYNDSQITRIAKSIYKKGYNFNCQDGDESYSACWGGTYSATIKWFAIACNRNNSSDCYCIDSTGSLMQGTSSTFSAPNTNNCACK